jgi:hypothetical protein
VNVWPISHSMMFWFKNYFVRSSDLTYAVIVQNSNEIGGQSTRLVEKFQKKSGNYEKHTYNYVILMKMQYTKTLRDNLNT